MVGPYKATFTEYALPSDQQAPSGLTVGSDGAVWFMVNDTSLDRITSAGTITTFSESTTAPGPFQTWITSGPDGRLWFAGTSTEPGIPNEPNCEQDYIGALTTAGIFQSYKPTHFCPNVDSHIAGNVARAADGDMWFIAFPCGLSCGSGLASVHADGTSARFLPLPGGNTFPSYLLSGPDGKLYLSLPARPQAGTPATLYRIDPFSAVVLATFTLPADVTSIAAGDDGNFWMTAWKANVIVRMTPGGTITQFPIPTSSSSPFSITSGSDGALWFTERDANKIGRITTTGAITEFPVPTANSAPDQIVSCPHQCENAHGRLWFTENAAAKIAKFEF